VFPIITLLAVSAGIYGLSALGVIYAANLEDIARVSIGIWFIVIAIFVHIITRNKTLAMIPESLPLRQQAVTLTGIFEALGGIGLLVPNQTVQLLASGGLVILLIIMFPANVYLASKAPSLDHWVRLPFQVVFIAWILWTGAYILH
jgi:uncharacterized membrane protein